jgi:serine/threonine protein kinase
VLDLLGPDLGKLLPRPASLKTTLMIALQLLTRLECLHTHGYIHNDLKLENIAIGRKHLQNVVYLVDFGLSVQHLSRGRPTRQRANVGTYLFSAIGTHKRDAAREVACPQHDLESLGYMIVFLQKGHLPWEHLCFAHNEDDNKIMKLKIAHRATLCNGMAEEVQLYMKYVHALKGEEGVDYDHLRDLLLQLLERSGLQNDGVFDWTTIFAPAPLPPIPVAQKAPLTEARADIVPPCLSSECVQDVTAAKSPRGVDLQSVSLRRCVSARRLLKDKLARATELNRAALLVRSQQEE